MDRATVVNNLVQLAAETMRAKADENDLVIDMIVDKPERQYLHDRLVEENVRIRAAVELMVENEGCWV